jgi:hypothetical protein
MDNKESGNPLIEDVECSELLAIGTNVLIETEKGDYCGVVESHLFTHYNYEGEEPLSTIIMECYEHKKRIV